MLVGLIYQTHQGHSKLVTILNLHKVDSFNALFDQILNSTLHKLKMTHFYH